MRTITLADGTVYNVTMCGASDGYLWITTPDITDMLTAVTVFGNPEKTGNITHKFGGNDNVTYEGYTTLTQIMLNNNGLTVSLYKGE